MTETTGNETEYTMGYNEDFLQLLARRSLETHGAHIIPYLKPGLQILDLGCGPGSMAMGLAEKIAPGTLHGIDQEESQIGIARAAAKAGGHDNTVFQTGDALDLPFPDATFDIVHCHAVTMHIPDTTTLLSEAMRVLKPGGIFSTRDMIGSGSFFEPDFGSLDAAMNTFLKLLAANGGHPQMGRESKTRLIEAGYTDIRASASYEYFTTPEDVAFWHHFVLDWFFSEAVIGPATKFGVATREQFDEWREKLGQWKDHPGAFGALAWGECIGFKP